MAKEKRKQKMPTQKDQKALTLFSPAFSPVTVHLFVFAQMHRRVGFHRRRGHQVGRPWLHTLGAPSAPAGWLQANAHGRRGGGSRQPRGIEGTLPGRRLARSPFLLLLRHA